jgi:hypothetical protein
MNYYALYLLPFLLLRMAACRVDVGWREPWLLLSREGAFLRFGDWIISGVKCFIRCKQCPAPRI